ncbi:MAG: hypothetical protein CSA89_00115 [Bacteroidales bacterium]|nr:MAG: hypothetical protein CSA89_00115 [Bacteroidales bacterium]
MKSIIGFFKSKVLWLNLLVAILLFVLILIVTFWGIKKYTRHGESIKVPNLIGLYENEALEILKQADLQIDIVDSVHLRTAEQGVIIEQTPKADSRVKGDRIIFVTINAKMKKQVAIPNLLYLSQRQATYTLQSLGFVVGNVNIVPSEYADMVIGINCDGKELSVGDKIPDGSTLSLTVGSNTYNADSIGGMPSVVGLTLSEAKDIITNQQLVVGYVAFDDPQPTTEEEKQNFKVYKQSPAEGEGIVLGKRVDIWLTTDLEKLDTQTSATDNEPQDDFFN